MSEAPKRYEDLSPVDKAHFLYPVFAAVTSHPEFRRSPSWKIRHSKSNDSLIAQMQDPDRSVRQYWEEHGLPQPTRIDIEGDAHRLLVAGYEDFRRIATSADRRLRVEHVRRRDRPPVLRRSHELLRMARVSLNDIKAKTDNAIPVSWVTSLRKPDAVYFGLHTAFPLRGTIYDASTEGLEQVRLTDTYTKWIEQKRAEGRAAGRVLCPAPQVAHDRADETRTNMLIASWESYVDGIYAGRPTPALPPPSA